MDKEPTLENSSTMTITKAQITTATVIDREDLEGNPNGFAIHINDGHTPTWYLRADSAREKKSWLMRLSHVHTIVRWLEDFEKVKVLGVGGTGIVYELLHKSNGQRFAMKEMEIKNKAQMQMAISEAEMLKDIMENVSHPNVMHIEKVFQVGSKFYLVFPLCTGGELYEHIIRRGHFTERDAAIITRDLISGLNALHSHDILHLDIKPENLLFDTMGEDAKIKITDFGLSKLFNDTMQQQQKSRFSMALMDEKLRMFLETGELNRDKLRGTIGYMSPELILCGHCCKGTDVFAAGVVLYILLCGRPPFNSKSNREVLERTARGQYSMVGAEWDEISEEAKDLVRKMLMVNPDDRYSCEQILQHPWIKQLDEEVDDSSLSSQSSSTLSTTLSPTHTKTLSLSSTRRITANSGHSGPNLASALRLLSGHVRQRQSEKLASSMTRLVSIMQQQGRGRTGSTLASMFLIPMSTQDIEIIAKHSSANQAEDFEMESVLLNTDFREGLIRAFQNIFSTGPDGLSQGKMSLEQFMMVLKHFYAFTPNSAAGDRNSTSTAASAATQTPGGSAGASGGMGLGPLIISRFIDRDGDGFITPDDIFAAQALILQRQEIFLKVIFRLYTESIWYPGRQVNLQWMLQQTPGKGPGGKDVPAREVSVLQAGEPICLHSVVEPPKFITQRHVSAVFEKLGYDPSCATKVFQILLEAVQRFKLKQQSMVSDDSSDAGEEDSSSKPPTTPSKPNAALAAAFGGSGDANDPTSSMASARKSTAVAAVAASTTEANGADKEGKDINIATASAASGGRMDFTDFCKAIEFDDILLQALFRKSRYRVMNILQEVETRVRSEQLPSLPEETEDEVSPRRRSSSNGRGRSREIAAALIEEELRAAMQVKADASRASFPIANAVGRAIGGFAAKVLGSKENEESTEGTSAKRDSLGRKSFFGSTAAAPTTPKPSDEIDSDDEIA
jgi:serine/threonine protein kinase